MFQIKCKEKHSLLIGTADHKAAGSLEEGEIHHMSSLDSSSSHTRKRDKITLVNANSIRVENVKKQKRSY